MFIEHNNLVMKTLRARDTLRNIIRIRFYEEM